VVGDVSDRDLGEGAVNQVYSPTALGYGTSNTRSMVVLARTRGRPEEDSAEAIRAAVVGVDEAEIEVTRLEPMRSLLAEVVARPRFNAFMMGWLAVVALALVLSGVYGVLAYTVGRRRRELGLRMALGARPAAVRGLMLREGLVPVAVGMAAGLALLAAFGRFLDAYLYGVELTDPVTLGLTLVLVLVMAAVACYLPARRASAVDPVESLRAE
jgi:putative ABC transport system permease protein